ncbi:division/cell wall cluster transcriptional repressor MraZ [Litoribacter alkaliphilus]|uniref:Transcriptional regulator MraZ n=1 Tax=Litoribacter ruber TaxID=702568 RepID=A0AAP2G4X6_9BACT|nr:division/cell wall cluster transcriptional repressor MraZ [Litoribacter alkaliphilus]MBS9523943.1 division/cell wall cluster transcriptional repressor MraZ [Litoribacter alkaliphilus]
MANFLSTFECKLDAKGRLVLPAKFKAALPEVQGGELILNLDKSGCVEIHVANDYQRRIGAKISNLDEFDPKAKALRRVLMARVSEVELDSAGRMLVPKNVLVHAGIDREAVLVGVGRYIEMWSPERFKESQNSLSEEEEAELIAKYLSQ